MNETESSQEQYLNTDSLFSMKEAEIISGILSVAAATIGQAELGPLMGPLAVTFHGILFGGLRAAIEHGATFEDLKSGENLTYLLKESIKAAALPFLTTVTINNFEWINSTLNLTENIDEIVLAILGITGGVAALGAVGYGIKKAGEGLISSLTRLASSIKEGSENFIKNMSELRPANPFDGFQSVAAEGNLQSPVKIQDPRKNVEKWQFPIKFKKFWKRNRSQDGEDS
jgi:hypothetical protein